MVAQRTLTPYVRVRILLPLPVEKALKVLILLHFEGFFVYENFQQISV